MKIKIKIKKLRPNAKMPTQGTKSAAGFDLYYAGDNHTFIPQHDTIRLETGIAFEIPEGYCGVVYSRSSTALKGLAITPLVVDSDYRGEVFVTVRNTHYRHAKARRQIKRIAEEIGGENGRMDE